MKYNQEKHHKGAFLEMVDLEGFEPLTSALRTRRSPN